MTGKPKPQQARPLRDLAGAMLADAFRKQGFAATELVTRWAAIVGEEIAAHAEPLRIQWPRRSGADEEEPPEPAILVLRVEGPAAVEIQHLGAVILDRVNRFFGWQAVGRIVLKQAPLSRRRKTPPRRLDAQAAATIAAGLPQIEDAALRAALGRLGAAVKKS